MTVSTSTNSVVYRGNGATTAFAVPFKVLDEDHLQVKRQVYATGALDYTYVGTDWSYVGIGDDSGTLTLDGAALSDTYQLVIERIVPYTQDLDIVNAGGFYAETVEEQLDLMVMGVQQLADLAGRGLVVPVGETVDALPAAASRANRYLGFGADGAPTLLEGSVTAGDVVSIPALSNYGDVDTEAEALATATAALADAGLGGTLFIDLEADIGAATVGNPGAAIIGERALHFSPAAGGGRRVVNHAGRDTSLLEWGEECLVRWLAGLRAGDTLEAEIVGDSNGTTGYFGGQLAFRLGSLPGVTVINNAIGGTSLEDWRTGANEYSGGGASKSMSSVIGRAPHLIVVTGFGPNDAIDGRTPAQFKTSLDAALTTIRATLPKQTTSILLCTPSSMNRADGADELYSHQLRPIYRQAALDFDCAFFDQNGQFPNAFTDFGTGDSENDWLDSDRVHLQPLPRDIMVERAMNLLVPTGTFGNLFIWQTLKAVAALPSAYPKGISSHRMNDGPFDGGVFTINPESTAGHFPLQIGWQLSGGAFYFRTVTASDVWQVGWAVAHLEYSGSKVHNFGSIADGDRETTTVTVTGANVGDFCQVALLGGAGGMRVWGDPTAPNTVTVYVENETGAPVDLAETTINVRVTSRAS